MCQPRGRCPLASSSFQAEVLGGEAGDWTPGQELWAGQGRGGGGRRERQGHLPGGGGLCVLGQRRSPQGHPAVTARPRLPGHPTSQGCPRLVSWAPALLQEYTRVIQAMAAYHSGNWRVGYAQRRFRPWKLEPESVRLAFWSTPHSPAPSRSRSRRRSGGQRVRGHLWHRNEAAPALLLWGERTCTSHVWKQRPVPLSPVAP